MTGTVWIVWDEFDYYGPDFVSVHATEEGARAAAARWVAKNPLYRDFHVSVQETEMLP